MGRIFALGTTVTSIYVPYFIRTGLKAKQNYIIYCSTEHMLAYFFTKALQGSLFAKFFDVTMGWKHVYTLQMGPPSTKERVENVVKVRSNQEEIESNMDTGGERIESSVKTYRVRTGYNVETNFSTEWRQRKKKKKCTIRTWK